MCICLKVQEQKLKNAGRKINQQTKDNSVNCISELQCPKFSEEGGELVLHSLWF